MNGTLGSLADTLDQLVVDLNDLADGLMGLNDVVMMVSNFTKWVLAVTSSLAVCVTTLCLLQKTSKTKDVQMNTTHCSSSRELGEVPRAKYPRFFLLGD